MTRASLLCSAPLLLAISLCGVACDPTLRTESRQVAIDADLEFLNRGAVSPAVLQGSTACLSFLGYWEGEEDAAEIVEATETALRACYSEGLGGPASFDRDSCIGFEAPGTVRWDATRVPCSLGTQDVFGDDAVTFDVVAPVDARAVYEFAVPVEAYLEGAQLELEGLDSVAIPEGIVPEPGEAIHVIEGGLSQLRVALVDARAPRLVAASGTAVSAVAAPSSLGMPELVGGVTTVDFRGTAGDVIDVALETAGGRFDVGEIHLASADAVTSLSAHPRIIREKGTDGFLEFGAVAVTRDAQGQVLRGAAVAWEVLEGDFEIEGSGAGDEARARGVGPRVSVGAPCRDAMAATAERTVLLEARFGALREIVRLDWTCVDLEDDGCGCQSAPADAPLENGRLAGLVLFGIVLRPRRRRRRSAAG